MFAQIPSLKTVQVICLFISFLWMHVAAASSITHFGELRKWHKVTIQYSSDDVYSETASPNPFTDRRLIVTFDNGSTTHVVEGYFAADGDAANSNSFSGNVWFAHVSPEQTGNWNYTARFYQGTDVAVASDPGSPVDTKTGSFVISETDKSGSDMRGKGILRYVNERYPRFDNGDYFIKAGPGDPENFLGYVDFDNSPNAKHDYSEHVGDWNAGDPT